MIKLNRSLLVALFVPAIAQLGCAHLDESDVSSNEIDAQLQPEATGSWYEPPSGRNGLKPGYFWSETAQKAYRDMQKYALKGGSRMIAGVNTPILRAPAGSDLNALLLTYPKAATDLIECALPAGAVIHDDVTGTDINGWWGIAPSWMNTPIVGATDIQEWLTGCMLARLNHYGVEVPILLEGDTTPIQTSSTWDSRMPYNESTVFGNMFNSTKPITGMSPAFDAYLCRENYLATTCPVDGGQSYARSRICDNVPSICGLIDIGLCDPTAAGSAANCKVGSTTEYWKCKNGTTSAIYEPRTVGIQLESAINPNTCY